MRTLLTALTALMLFTTPAVAGAWEDARAAFIAGDYQKAFRLSKPLAEQGVARAQLYLGLMYFNGVGVPENYVKAYAWWSIASALGVELAKKNKGFIKERMTPEQIARVKN